jgi:hypothetical protein
MRFFYCFIFIFLNVICHSQNWQPLAGGVGIYEVKTMYADSNYLYVAGNFSTVDGKHLKGIARWNGNIWDSLSSGVDGLDIGNQWPSGSIVTMEEYNNELYVGGAFSSLGSVAAYGFGKWNGTSWDTISIQPEGAGELKVIDNALYLGGGFDTLAGIAANSIIKWDGSSWHSLGFPNFYVFPFIHHYAAIGSICEYNGKIYAAGNFESYPLGTDTVGNILCYDGSNWTSVAGGVKGFNAGISDMIVYHDELYVAGYFFKADGNPGENIQKWNGSSWSDVGGGTGYSNGSIYKLIIWHDKLYAVGVLEEAGGVPADRIAVWDGIKWCGLGSDFENVILTGAVFHDSLFIGGGFKTIDGDSLTRIAKWTGGDFTDTCSTIGVSENEFADQFYFFPNPAFSSITFSYPYNTKQVQIIDVFGREFKTIVLSTSTTTSQIDISDLPSGIYFLKLINEHGSLTKKMIKV